MSGEVTYVNPPGMRTLKPLYSHVSRVKPGELLFFAGQLAADDNGDVIGPGDLGAQLVAVLDSIGRLLSEFDADFDSIARFTTYLTDADDIEDFMRAREAVFPKLFKGPLYPPNTLLIVNRLVKPEFLIEIDTVVSIPA